MKLKLVLLVLFIAFNFLNAKEHKNNFLNFKVHLSESPYYFNEFYVLSDFMNKKTSRLSIEANYLISKYFDAGLYLGYSTYKKHILITNENIGEFSNNPLLFFGLSSNLHLLPILVHKNNFWADLYMCFNVGTINYVGARFPSNSIYKPFEYGIYGGAALYPGRHWGLFYEHGIGNYFRNRFGISLKF